MFESMHRAKRSTMSLLRIDDDTIQAKMGDVLLFLQDAAHPDWTVVASAYTPNVYYTLLTDAGGSYTQIVKGSVNSRIDLFAHSALLATVSTARKHRLWNANLSPSQFTRPLTEGAMSLFRRPSHYPHVGKEKNSGIDALHGDKAATPDCASGSSEKTWTANEDAEMDEKDKTSRSLTNDVSRDREMVMITYGRGAPAYVRDCLRMEKHS